MKATKKIITTSSIPTPSPDLVSSSIPSHSSSGGWVTKFKKKTIYYATFSVLYFYIIPAFLKSKVYFKYKNVTKPCRP